MNYAYRAQSARLFLSPVLGTSGYGLLEANPSFPGGAGSLTRDLDVSPSYLG